MTLIIFKKSYSHIIAIGLCLNLIGCSNKSEPTPNNNNPVSVTCTSSPTITLASKTNTGCGTSNGIITVSGSGGKGSLRFNISGGTFQSGTTFNNLAPGNYEIGVKDSLGCISTLSVNINSGTSYNTSVKSVIQANCAISSCHVAGGQSPNLSTLSNIQSNANNIKSRTSSKTMPPANSGRSLSNTEIQNIQCWVDDGAPNN